MERKQFDKVVAMDGPSGSGKSTLAKSLASKCSFLFVDTGAMYRAIGLHLHNEKIDFEEGPKLCEALNGLGMRYTGDVGADYISVNSVKLGEKIRDHFVSELASEVSKLPSVREFLVNFQRQLPNNQFCVMEGRDISTVVFPNAFFKVYLTANDEVRAKRRFDQLKEAGQTDVNFEQVINDVRARDKMDMDRDIAPLKKADDAIELDTSEMTQNQVLDRLESLVKERRSELGL